MPNECLFPDDLARADFGAAAWAAPDGSSVLLERTQEGFRGAYEDPNGMSFVATWVGEASARGLSHRLSAMQGPGSEAMDRAGIPWQLRHARVMDVMGACALMATHSASVGPEDLESLRSAKDGVALAQLLGIEPRESARSRLRRGSAP